MTSVFVIIIIIFSFFYYFIIIIIIIILVILSKSHLDIDYVPPTDIGSSYHARDSIRTTFSVAVPTVWNSLPHEFRYHRRVMLLTDSNSSLKRSCSASASVASALEVSFNAMRYINLRFIYLLTYLIICWLWHRCSSCIVIVSAQSSTRWCQVETQTDDRQTCRHASSSRRDWQLGLDPSRLDCHLQSATRHAGQSQARTRYLYRLIITIVSV